MNLSKVTDATDIKQGQHKRRNDVAETLKKKLCFFPYIFQIISEAPYVFKTLISVLKILEERALPLWRIYNTSLSLEISAVPVFHYHIE